MTLRRWLALGVVLVAGWQLHQGLQRHAPMAGGSAGEPSAAVGMPISSPSALDAPPAAGMPPAEQGGSVQAWQRFLAQSSLRGSQADGDWTVAPDGRLRPDPALRRRLDHYLALQGELPLDRLRDALVAEVAGLHGPRAATELRALWTAYVSLQQHRWQAVADPSRPETLAAALAERTQVRRQWLGPAMAEAFYREEDDALRQAIARWNSGGAPASFASVAEVTSHPPPLGQAWVQQQAVQESWSAWEQRLSDARSEQLRLQADAGLSAAQRTAAMAAYLQGHFSPAERPRVEALLRLMPP